MLQAAASALREGVPWPAALATQMPAITTWLQRSVGNHALARCMRSAPVIVPQRLPDGPKLSEESENTIANWNEYFDTLLPFLVAFEKDAKPESLGLDSNAEWQAVKQRLTWAGRTLSAFNSNLMHEKREPAARKSGKHEEKEEKERESEKKKEHEKPDDEDEREESEGTVPTTWAGLEAKWMNVKDHLNKVKSYKVSDRQRLASQAALALEPVVQLTDEEHRWIDEIMEAALEIGVEPALVEKIGDSIKSVRSADTIATGFLKLIRGSSGTCGSRAGRVDSTASHSSRTSRSSSSTAKGSPGPSPRSRPRCRLSAADEPSRTKRSRWGSKSRGPGRTTRGATPRTSTSPTPTSVGR